MMLDAFGDISWLAVFLAALAWFALGAAWYIAPPIARRWQRAGGIDVPDDASPNPAVFALTFAAYMVAAGATALLASSIGVDSIAAGASLGAVVGVGYAVTGAAVAAIYDDKPEPFGWFWINGVFNLAGLIVVGGIVGAFA